MLLAAIVLLLAAFDIGYVFYPTPRTVPTDAELQRLITKTDAEVVEALGRPDKEFQSQDGQIWMYWWKPDTGIGNAAILEFKDGKCISADLQGAINPNSPPAEQ